MRRSRPLSRHRSAAWAPGCDTPPPVSAVSAADAGDAGDADRDTGDADRDTGDTGDADRTPGTPTGIPGRRRPGYRGTPTGTPGIPGRSASDRSIFRVSSGVAGIAPGSPRPARVQPLRDEIPGRRRRPPRTPAELSMRLDPDPNSAPGGYRVQSVYYDTKDLASTGRRSRGCGSAQTAYPAVRLRSQHRLHPGVPRRSNTGEPGDPETADHPPLPEALRLCDDRQPDTAGPWPRERGQEVPPRSRGWTSGPPRPPVYLRQAFTGHDSDLGCG